MIGIILSRNIKASGKVFRDPVHKLIRIGPSDEFLLELLDTPEFQRLRRVRQLGVSNLSFHGAEHSRFSHSMGVFNFAQRILDALIRRYEDKPEVIEYLKEHEKVVKAAALLHDIGHGPFSHMLERAFDGGEKHETVTTKIIRDSESEVYKTLEEASVCSEDVAGIIDGTSSHQLLKDIVSSQLDADRMDYLLRDALCTGVEYGHYDAEWLLNALCIGRDPGSNKLKPENWRLCLDEQRGLPSAEQFILARAHMSEQVYFHRVTRGYEVLLLILFKEVARIVEQGESLPDGTSPSVRLYFENKGKLDLSDWLQFDEATMISALHTWAKNDDRIGSLSRSFLQRERRFIGVRIPLRFGANWADLTMKLNEVGKRGVDWEFDRGGFAVYKGLLAGSSERKGEEEESIESILLSDGDPNSFAKASEAESLLLRSMDDARKSMNRLYFDRNQEKDIKPIVDIFKLAGG